MSEEADSRSELSREDLTLLLKEVNAGESEAKEKLIAGVYSQLRKIAQRQISRERSDHTLQATELVHEAYLKMAGHLERNEWKNRAHFFGAAAEAMRRILINYARSRNTAKRGSGRRPEAINVLELAEEQDPEQILIVDEAIQRLKEKDPKLGELVQLRFFAGLSVEQTAEVLESSPRTVGRQWQFARAWLTRTIEEMIDDKRSP